MDTCRREDIKSLASNGMHSGYSIGIVESRPLGIRDTGPEPVINASKQCLGSLPILIRNLDPPAMNISSRFTDFCNKKRTY